MSAHGYRLARCPECHRRRHVWTSTDFDASDVLVMVLNRCSQGHIWFVRVPWVTPRWVTRQVIQSLSNRLTMTGLITREYRE